MATKEQIATLQARVEELEADLKAGIKLVPAEIAAVMAENLKLKEAIAHIDKLCTHNAYHLDFVLACAIKNAAALLESSDE